VILRSATTQAFFRPSDAGALVELDYLPSRFNVANVVSRWRERYHGEDDLAHAPVPVGDLASPHEQAIGIRPADLEGRPFDRLPLRSLRDFVCELPPDPATLGPGYEITYTFMGKGSDQTVEVPLFGAGAKIDLSVPFTQTLYPYAPERPLVYTAPGQVFLSRMMGQWWSAPPALRAWLVSKGLPVAPVVVPAPAKPPSTPKVPAGAGYSWAVAFAITGLLAMVVTAALAGRRAWCAGTA